MLFFSALFSAKQYPLMTMPRRQLKKTLQGNELTEMLMPFCSVLVSSPCFFTYVEPFGMTRQK